MRLNESPLALQVNVSDPAEPSMCLEGKLYRSGLDRQRCTSGHAGAYARRSNGFKVEALDRGFMRRYRLEMP